MSVTFIAGSAKIKILSVALNSLQITLTTGAFLVLVQSVLTGPVLGIELKDA